jgi:hypothetical protein
VERAFIGESYEGGGVPRWAADSGVCTAPGGRGDARPVTPRGGAGDGIWKWRSAESRFLVALLVTRFNSSSA